MTLQKVSANKVYNGVLTKYRFKVRLFSSIYFLHSNSEVAIPECCIGRVGSPVQPLYPHQRLLDTQGPGVNLPSWSYLHRRHRVRHIVSTQLLNHLATKPSDRQRSKGQFSRSSRKRGHRPPLLRHLTPWCGHRRRRQRLGLRHRRWLLSQCN